MSALPIADWHLEVPLTQDEFDASMQSLGPYEAAPHLAVAVSGGADSLSLAIFADRWARRAGGRITGVTVDHGLRGGSRAEAERVTGWLTKRSISHEILTWTGAKPSTGVQAAARNARYALLNRWCRDAGVLHLLVGHQRDDQAETMLIRLAAGSGGDGLGGIEAVRHLYDVRVLRPLLAVPRIRLETFLVAEEQSWLCDPSNQDTAFARVRVRSALSGDAAESQTRALAGKSAEFRQMRMRRRAAAAVLIARSVALHPAGFCTIDPLHWQEATDPVALGGLAAILAAIGGVRWQRGEAALRKLLPIIRGATPKGLAGSLSRCRVTRVGDRIYVCRENRSLPEPTPFSAGHPSMLWDNRFRLNLAPAAESNGAETSQPHVVVPLRDDGWRRLVAEVPALRASALPHEVRITLPALVCARGKIVSVPHLSSDCALDPVVSSRVFSAIFHPRLNLSANGYFLEWSKSVTFSQ